VSVQLGGWGVEASTFCGLLTVSRASTMPSHRGMYTPDLHQCNHSLPPPTPPFGTSDQLIDNQWKRKEGREAATVCDRCAARWGCKLPHEHQLSTTHIGPLFVPLIGCTYPCCSRLLLLIWTLLFFANDPRRLEWALEARLGQGSARTHTTLVNGVERDPPSYSSQVFSAIVVPRFLAYPFFWMRRQFHTAILLRSDIAE
jgi:hypothetical protein